MSGWYIPHPGATSTILLSPGYRGKAEDVLNFALPLWKAGYNVLAGEVEAFVLDSPFASHRSVLAYNFRRLVHLPFGLVAPLVDLLLGPSTLSRSR